MMHGQNHIKFVLYKFTYIRHPVIRSQHLLCLAGTEYAILSNTTVWKALKNYNLKLNLASIESSGIMVLSTRL